MKKILSLFLAVIAITVNAASPSYENFNSSHFSRSGNNISIKTEVLGGGGGTSGALTNNDTRADQLLPFMSIGLPYATNSIRFENFLGYGTNAYFYRKAHLTYTNGGYGAMWWDGSSVTPDGDLYVTNNTGELDIGFNLGGGWPNELQGYTWNSYPMTAFWNAENDIHADNITAYSVSAATLSGNGSGITGQSYVTTNDQRNLVLGSAIFSVGTNQHSRIGFTNSQFFVNYYPGSTNFLYFSGKQLWLPAASTTDDAGIAWANGYIRLGNGTTDSGLLVRPNAGIALEMPKDDNKLRIGDDHRSDQLIDICSGASSSLTLAEQDWLNQRSHILGFRSMSTNRYYCFAALQSRNPDETSVWNWNGANYGYADLFAYYALPVRSYNTNGGWQMNSATNVIFSGGKNGFDVWGGKFNTMLRVTNEIAGTNIAIIGRSGSVINGVGFTNKTIDLIRVNRHDGDVSDSDATFTDSNAIEAALPESGRRYVVEFVCYVDNTLASDGIKFDLQNGTATFSSIRAHFIGHDSTGLIINAASTALSTVVSSSTLTGNGLVVVKIGCLTSAAGTLKLRFAEVTDGAGSATLRANSHVKVTAQ